MLVIGCCAGESIMIGDDVEVEVVSAKGGNIRIAIKAPREISIHREELYKRIKDEEEVLTT